MPNAIPPVESLTVEFKSDRGRLADDELVATVVCLANTEGGEVYLGVEDDDRATGLHPAHQNLAGLSALIANRTVPPVSVRVTVLEVEGTRAAKIEVPLARRPVARSDGLLLRRRLLADGWAECVPMYPHEIDRREADLGLLDYSARPVAGAAAADLDPLERTRLRQAIQQYGGDRALLALSDDELDGALGLARRQDGTAVPTVAGLLLLGSEAALREHLPTHEVAFQDLVGTQVRANEFYRRPLLWVIEEVMRHVGARNREEELLIGPYRVPVPAFDAAAVREALANAVTHRDYTQLGAVHVRWLGDAVEVSNPGGFPEGVSVSQPARDRAAPAQPAAGRRAQVDRLGRADRARHRPHLPGDAALRPAAA
jgi:ATP-dependent DNA helicase RecG